MGPMRFLALLTAGLLSLAAAGSVTAAPVAAATPRTATVTLMVPANVRKMNDLNFAYLAVTTAGTAVINPNTDVMTTTGGVTYIGGTPYSALFETIAPTKTVVHIRTPNQPITLTRVGGTETMTVSNFTLSGSGTRNVVAKEPISFSVGGTLNVNANQVEGVYVGTFTVDVQYN